MRKAVTFVGILAAAALGGCGGGLRFEDQGPSAPQRIAAEEWAVHSIQDTAINNAIITQHAVFPYHFVAETAQLNDLGKRDLGVLVAHYKELGNPGGAAFPISVRRGDAPTTLYMARVASVQGAIKEAGIEPARVAVTDNVPGGGGMSSERTVQILAKDRDAKPFMDSMQGSGGAVGTGGTVSGK